MVELSYDRGDADSAVGVTLQGIDVSGWQPDSITRDVDYDFAIIKISEGTSFRASLAAAQYQGAKGRGKLLGVYHFATTEDPAAEADHFVATAQPYLREAILVLDFEADAIDAWGGKGAKVFLDRLHARTGIKAAIYCSSSVAERADMKPVAETGYPLWVASWGANSVGGYRTPTAPSTGHWKTAFIHQYTSNGILPGYTGRLDLNITDATPAEWAALAGGTRKTVVQLAAEVWDGLWGNGDDRRRRLTAAGYDYTAVQAEVDKGRVPTTADVRGVWVAAGRSGDAFDRWLTARSA